MDNYVFFLLILVIPLIAVIRTSFIYSKYKENNKAKLSGFEVARKILDENNLKDMYIVEVKGTSNDYYDYNHKAIKLSTDIFHGETITAEAVAAFYSVQAILDKEENKFYRFRAFLLPITKFCTYITYILFLIAMSTNDYNMLMVSIALEFIIIVFHFITLPIDFETNKRAIKYLNDYELLDKEELESSEEILKAASFNCVGSMITLIIDLIKQAMYSISKRN